MVESMNSDSEVEVKKYRPMIAGVKHNPENIPEILNFLDEINLTGKKVMLEIASYPIQEKYVKSNKGFCEFFEAVAQRVMMGGGIILAGDSEELIDRAAVELNKLYLHSPSSYFCEYREIASREREPYFLEFTKENKPDVIILDFGHADYVASELGIGLHKVSV
jgi:hypothetical protein